jgi:hypothetical protein
MKVIRQKMLKILLAIAVPILATGCAGDIPKLDANTEFGPAPQHYQQTIKNYFAENLNNPEVAEYVISDPMKFYRAKQSLAGLGGGVQWHAWVAEVGIPGKAVYKFLSGYNENLVYYYVRFDGDRIEAVYDGNTYDSLKNETGFTVGEYATIDNVKLTPEAIEETKVNKDVIRNFEVIRELNKLYQEGILTEEEFTQKKRALLEI